MEQLMLDMIPSGIKAIAHASQYDVGRIIRFNLVSKGVPYTLDGTETIRIDIRKPDGTTGSRNVANTSSTYVEWVTGEGDCDQSGNNKCELVITKGSAIIGSKNFVMKVESDPYDGEGVVVETASGAIATFTTNIVDLLQSVKCGINAWSDSNVIEKEPYNFRKVAGTASRIGNHLFDKLVGGTVAWNQLIATNKIRETRTINNVVFTNNNDGSFTLTGTADASNYNVGQYGQIDTDSSHKYLRTTVDENGKVKLIIQTNITSTQGEFSIISGVTYNVTVKSQLFDLTQMFGSTIADYIYSLEQATAGSGVNFFRKLFSDSYYAYNAGELMSVKTTAHKMVGFNAFDEDMELGTLSVYTGEPVVDNRMLRSKNFCRCFPNTLYNLTYKGTVNASGMRVFLYDENYQFYDFWGFTNNVGREVDFEKAHYFKVGLNEEYGTTYKNDICVNVSKTSGTPKNGDYLPYSAHTYALDDVELRGLFKLDSNNKLYADGDTYESSSYVTRKYKLVDLGSLWWSLADGVFRAIIDGIKNPITYDDRKTGFLFSSKYMPDTQVSISGDSMTDKSALRYDGRIFIKDTAYNDTTAFTNSLDGVYLVCELATPTTETADTFTNPQQVDANGTEEYVDNRSVAIPVGHETYYAQAYSECNVMANGTTHNIPFGELIVESAELDVTNGILKRHDDTTKQLTPLALEAVLGQNSVSCDTGNTEVKYLYNA